MQRSNQPSFLSANMVCQRLVPIVEILDFLYHTLELTNNNFLCIAASHKVFNKT